MTIGNVLEPVLVGTAVLAYIAYHVYFWHRYRNKPMSTTIGHNHVARKIWCEVVMRERRDILAVQTIRNTLMSSSLMASTSLTLSAVVAAYLVNTISIEGPFGLDLLSSSYLHPIHKFFAVILAFTVAFYCYMQSIRASNHASYLLGLPLLGDRGFTPHYVAHVIKRGADFHTAGTRIFYLAFVFVLWIFGPLPPFIVMMILIPHLWYLDKADPSTVIYLTPLAPSPAIKASPSSSPV